MVEFIASVTAEAITACNKVVERQFKGIIRNVIVTYVDMDTDRGFTSVDVAFETKRGNRWYPGISRGYAKRNNATHDVQNETTGVSLAFRDALRRSFGVARS